MYDENELSLLRRQIKKRWLMTLLPAAILLAGLIAALVRRNEIAADVCSILMGIVLIFSWGLLIKPLRDYAAYVARALHGNRHQAEGGWLRVDPDISVVDGVRCHAVYISCTDGKNKPYERLFYTDDEKLLPNYAEGLTVCVTYTGKQVIAIDPVGN